MKYFLFSSKRKPFVESYLVNIVISKQILNLFSGGVSLFFIEFYVWSADQIFDLLRDLF